MPRGNDPAIGRHIERREDRIVDTAVAGVDHTLDPVQISIPTYFGNAGQVVDGVVDPQDIEAGVGGSFASHQRGEVRVVVIGHRAGVAGEIGLDQQDAIDGRGNPRHSFGDIEAVGDLVVVDLETRHLAVEGRVAVADGPAL